MNDHETPKEQNVFKDEHKKMPTSSGLEENIAGLLCYITIIGLIFIFVEKENLFVRFHALQAIFTTVAVIGLFIILSFIPFIGWLISLLLSPIIFLLFIFLMYQAYKHKKFKLPIFGDLAEQHATPKI